METARLALWLIHLPAVSCEVEPFEGWKLTAIVSTGLEVQIVSCEVEPFEGWKPAHVVLPAHEIEVGQLRGRTL